MNFRKYQSMREWGWFVIIQKTRPLIGMPDPNEELRILEEKANATYGVYKEKCDTKVRLLAENEVIVEEKKALLAQIEKEQGNMSQYHERQSKCNSEKADLEIALVQAQHKLSDTEQARIQATNDKKSLEQETVLIKKDIGDIEMAITKLEQEKTNRDHTIKSLNDEIANQDEIINKLNKEKKHLSENSAKSSEDLQIAGEKVDHLNKVKSKLESTLDELESSVEKEKRSRAQVDKERRKVEGELKMAQETVSEIERSKKELEAAIMRKESEIMGLSSKLEDEQSLVGKVQKSIREQQGRIEEMEEELEAERQARAKAERQRSDLAREMESLGERLNEASGATSAQVELNKKRESEVTKLRKDLEECRIQHDATLVSLKKKQADSIAEMSEQMDQLNKMKSKVNKDCSQIMAEVQDVRAATDEVGRSKASAEKSQRALAGTLTDMTKTKSALVSALDEMKAIADHEAKERVSLLGKYRNMEHMADGLKENYDEEVCAKENLARQLNKALGDADMWRQKYEIDGIAKAEELEMAKMKLQARLSEGQATIEQLGLKLQQLEKSKAKAAADAADMAQQLDQAQILNAAMEKKAKQFDRIVGEWKQKVDSLGMDLDCAQKETRNISSELFRVKNAYDKSILQLEEVRRENKVLSNEIKDIMDQISEGGRSIHEIDKIRKRLEAEKLELEAALSEAEGALEQEENKVLRAQIELTQIRKEVDHRINEKDEEFASPKKNFGKAIEGMQMTLESETKAKVEALRMKKKLETDVADLETALEHANNANMESQKSIKGIQLRLRDVQVKLEDENRAKEVARDNLMAADRRAHANQNALEEARTLLEQVDRNRRTLEQKLADTNETLGDQTCTNQALTGAKQKCESEINTLSHDLDEMASEAHMSEEKAQRAMIDAARLADELRAEQEAAMILERDRKLLEAQVKDANVRLDEAEQNALKGGKKAMAKMDTRIRELESELDAENRRSADAQKNLRKSERHVKELTYTQDEDRKNHERMQALIDQLQGKIKSYKKQIEEAEEIAALNLAKYRPVQGNLAASGERADLNEQALAKMKASSRAASLGPM